VLFIPQVMGWGSRSEGATNADTLYEVTVDVTSLASCNQTYKGNLRPTQLCAGVPQGGAGGRVYFMSHD
jgi:hypothetical protein